MNRRNFLKTSAAVTASAAVFSPSSLLVTKAHAQSSTNIYERPLHITWCDKGGPCFASQGYTEARFMAAFTAVPLTAVTPFFLNVLNPMDDYSHFIGDLQTNNIAIIPGVGGDPSAGNLFSTPNQNIVLGYQAFTNCIRLENCTGFYQAYGQSDIQNMINFCVDHGFEHIMLNPWPKLSPSGAVVPFTPLSVLDASFNQIELDFDNSSPYTVYSNPTNWYPDTTWAQKVITYNPNCNIVVNYESVPQQAALANQETQTGSSEADMQVTVTQIQQASSSLNLRWAPPFSTQYDPFALKTWPWISGKLASF